MDALSDLGFFVLLARQGSLATTAQQMGVSPPTVSKRLAALEQRLGVRLLNRTTRRASLTAEGEAYLADGARLLDELAALEQTVSGAAAAPRGLLRVNATLGFGRHHVAPALSDFGRLHPEVEFELNLSDRPLNLVEQGYDVGIRFGDLPDAGLRVRLLAINHRLLCAAPAYLERAGMPASPADLARHRCLVIRQADEPYHRWQLQHGARHETVRLHGGPSTNHGETALAWALEGQGILLRSEWHAAPYLRSGRLQRVLPGWTLPRADIHLVYPSRAHLSAKLRRFVDFMVERFAPQRDPAPDAPRW